MARTKAELGSGARLADYLSVSLLARVFPAEQVHLALDAHGCNSQRIRRFPAVAGAYYAMALSLYPEASYESVFSAVAEGLAWAAGAAPPPAVAKSSISGLRSRIGAAPLRDLMRSCCVPLADAQALPQAFYAGLRVVAIDGSRVELADEAPVALEFGRPGSRTGQAGYPHAQCVVLAECATHAILAAEIGPYRGDEWELCRWLLGALEPGMLCLADRGFNGTVQWQQALATGAQLLWRASDNRLLPVKQMLGDGSYLSELEPSRRRATQAAAPHASVVRVIEYQLPGTPSGQARYRLITSLLDPQQAPALELAQLYHRRWQIEQVFDELKTHLRQSRRVLRSKTVELVRQEFYGWVLAHYAVRWLLHQGAARSGQADEDLSFTAHVQLLKREQPRSGAFPPRAPEEAPARLQRGFGRQRATALRAHT
jgi:hypothetical protein